MSSLPAAPQQPSRLRNFGLRGLQTLGIALFVAIFLAMLSEQSFEKSLVYAVCISLGCWLFIDGGRMLAARWVHRAAPGGSAQAQAEWPGWGWMSLVLPLGTLAGYSVGLYIAQQLLGSPGPRPGETGLRSFTAMLLFSLIPGVAVTYFFYSRGRLATSRAQAEQAERLAAEQRLKLLASQLEPHMLFNTLANLRALIGTDPPRATAMLDRLILFLRATLNASRASTHPLADEFARLADYLALMQVRMGARLQTRLTLPNALAALPVPTLLLQPLVENAIKHGLEPHVQGGQIEVSAANEGGLLVLRVRDTGAGLAPALLQAPSRTFQQAGNGFGLEQVRERLAALYGAAASLELAPAPDAEGGTLATLRLPL